MHITVKKFFDNRLLIFKTGSRFYKQLPVFWLLFNITSVTDMYVNAGEVLEFS